MSEVHHAKEALQLPFDIVEKVVRLLLSTSGRCGWNACTLRLLGRAWKDAFDAQLQPLKEIDIVGELQLEGGQLPLWPSSQRVAKDGLERWLARRGAAGVTLRLDLVCRRGHTWDVQASQDVYRAAQTALGGRLRELVLVVREGIAGRLPKLFCRGFAPARLVLRAAGLDSPSGRTSKASAEWGPKLAQALEKLPHLQSLELHGGSLAVPLDQLAPKTGIGLGRRPFELTRLHLACDSACFPAPEAAGADLSWLALFPRLEQLVLGCELRPASDHALTLGNLALAGHPSLTRLQLSADWYLRLVPNAPPSRLRHLEVACMYRQAGDFEGMAGAAFTALSALTHLSVGEESELEGVSLAAAAQLQHLSLRCFLEEGGATLASISTLSLLTHLEFEHEEVDTLVDVDWAASFGALAHLNTGGSPLAWLQGALLALPQAVTYLGLSASQFVGEDSLDFGHLARGLAHLDLSETNITQLKGISALSLLTSLDLSWTHVPGLESALPALPRLARLKATCAGLAALPAALSALSALTCLVASHNDFQAGLSLPPLPLLERLDLSNCSLPALPDGLGRLSALTHLDLSRNKLGPCGGGGGCLAPLAALQHLALSRNGLQVLPGGLGALTALTHLDVSANDLLAGLPACITALSRLRRLDLGRTHLRQLPAGLRSLTALTRLDHFRLTLGPASPLDAAWLARRFRRAGSGEGLLVARDY